MASDYSRKSETASQALDSLFAILESGQKIDLAYRAGLDGGRARFSLEVRGSTRGSTAREAEENARRLKRNLELALHVRPGLHFRDAAPDAATEFRPIWRACLQLQGLLVSSQSGLKSLPQPALPAIVLISPLLPPAVSDFSFIDAMLISPHPVEIMVSIQSYRLDEPARQGVSRLLDAMDQRKATCFQLPERRQVSPEEQEILFSALEHHLKHWLLNPSGIELSCTVHSAERPPETLLAMLGKALFPQQRFTWSIWQIGAESSAPVGEEESAALDLRRCIHASCDFPVLFPSAEQLADTGTRRCYPRPSAMLAPSGLRLGITSQEAVYLTHADRSRHTYILGATGSGKSTLVYHMITQDIAKGEGVCLIDPHGDLYREVLDAIPGNRAKDVVLFNPCDFEHAVGLNFLECTGPHPKAQMNLIVNEMIKIFDRLYDLRQTGGPMFEMYMRNALLLVMDNDAPGTLMDVPRLFEDENYRNHLKRICQNSLAVRFWNGQAERAGGEAALANITPYVTSKLNQFTHNALLRPIIGQRKSTLDFRQIMDHRQILLVNLSKGLLGEFDSQLLGMLLIGKLFLAAMGRAGIPETRRIPFHGYIDEFQNFTTDAVAHLLSESRKFGIYLTLANQNMAQLHRGYGRDNLLETVLGNVGNLLFFRMGAADAERLVAYTRPEVGAQDLQYLPDFHAVARLLHHNSPLRPFVFQTLPKPPKRRITQATAIIRDCILDHRRHYTRPVSEVEREIMRQANGLAEERVCEESAGAQSGIMLTATPAANQETLSIEQMRQLSKSELLALPLVRCGHFSVRTLKSLRSFGIRRPAEFSFPHIALWM